MKKIVIQGFPYDEKSSFQKGAALAPPLIRKALYADSMNLYAENGKLIKGERILDLGDFTIDNYFEIEKLSADHLMEADLIFSLGGNVLFLKTTTESVVNFVISNFLFIMLF